MLKPSSSFKPASANSEGSPLSKFLFPGLIERSFSSLILVPLVLFPVLMGSPYVDCLILVVALGVVGEWGFVCVKARKSLMKRVLWFLAGVVYSAPALWMFWRVGRSTPFALLGICLLIWASDIGAYLSGKTLGGPKLAPHISPNKTWSGVLGGFAFSLAVGILMVAFFKWTPGPLFQSEGAPLGATFYMIFAIALFSQLGDLLESWVKRRFHLKDTSKIIPGHGGLWDRVDSFIAVGLFLFIHWLFYNT